MQLLLSVVTVLLFSSLGRGQVCGDVGRDLLNRIIELESANQQLKEQLQTIHNEDSADLVERMQHLEGRKEQLERRARLLQAINGVNSTGYISIPLQERLDSMEEKLTQQAALINQLQSQALNLSRVQIDLKESVDFIAQEVTNTKVTVGSLEEKHYSLETSIKQMSANTNFQLLTLNSTKAAILQDLNTLRSVDLYQNCTMKTKSCTLAVDARHQYRIQCSTSTLTVELTDTQYHTADIRCEFEASTVYHESATVVRNGNTVRCECGVTYPYSTGAGHGTLPLDYTGTCTLIMNRCPRLVNLLG